MLTPEQLKSKYPLALDTIKLPVRYSTDYTHVIDSEDRMFLKIWTVLNGTEHNDEATDQIGELIAHLLNQLK